MRSDPNSRGRRPANGHAPKSILLIRWKSIGDVVFTLPALRCLRSNFPDSHITYLTSPEFVPLIECFPGIDEILTLDRARLKRFYSGGIISFLKLLGRITRARYDLVLDLQGYGETAWLSWLTRAPERWGHVHRPSRAWAYTRAVQRDEKAHPAAAILKVLADCGLETAGAENVFDLPLENQRAAGKLFSQFGLRSDRPTVFIQPFTSSPKKNWPLEKWLQLSRQLRELNIQVLFGGGPSERSRLEPALEQKFPIAAGTDLLTSCSLARRCAVTTGGDTGLLHLANASGCRVLLLKHFTAKECPYGHPDWVLTPPRKGILVAEIDPHLVLAEIRRVIDLEWPATRQSVAVEATA